MRVSKCGEEVFPDAYPLRWEDIIEREGVYEAAGRYGHWVVVAAALDKLPTAQFWIGDGSVERVPESSDKNRYKRVHEARLCAEVKLPTR
jgi:hypothetical protein